MENTFFFSLEVLEGKTKSRQGDEQIIRNEKHCAQTIFE